MGSALHTSFALYRSVALRTVVVETLTTDLYLRDDPDVDMYETVYGWLEDAALPPEESTELIASLSARE